MSDEAPDTRLTLPNGLRYDTFLHTPAQMEGMCPIVVLAYSAFCDPCRSTKHYIEEFARKHGFGLIRLDMAFSLDPERAGETTPYIQVYHGVDKPTQPLVGAQTARAICEYLILHNVIKVSE